MRQWYDANLRDTIETYLRKIGITYLVDMDNTDYDNIKSLHQKRDRQIIFIFAIIYWIGETIWDWIMAPPKDAPKKKGKSIIQSAPSTSASDVKDKK